MSSIVKKGFGNRQSDGFATLTASMMERETMPRPASQIEAKSDGGDVPASARRRSALQPSQPFAVSEIPKTDDRPYAGRERRQHDISPVVERRKSVPPRIKISVRLEQARHNRLKAAALLLERTHQDLVTVALDRYLDQLQIPGKTTPNGI